MEPSYKKRRIIAACLGLFCVCALGYAAWVQWQSQLVGQLISRADTPVELTVLTQPAMFFSYVPATHQANVRVLSDKKSSEKSLRERAQKMLAAEKISPQIPLKYIEPATSDREAFWADFKNTLTRWRYNPLLGMRAVWAYLKALHQGRTNLSPAEFVLLTLELTQLETNDFTVRFPEKQKKKKKASTPEASTSERILPDRAPLAVENRPIIVEVLNASGKKGLALELTQYLREQNTKGLLRVDVLQYDNYPTQQETSWLEDYSGRQIQLKQLGSAIGITEEIRVGTTPNVICDTRIILGKDFRMPL
ncbi:MAG: LytR C-terminal domain-containing protein [Elusimicrobiaceae bacterium]|nr:LytR C-terminal domain-containing protein [Elusimicrobiaceae bacterium]